jgi:hypothetical protein
MINDCRLKQFFKKKFSSLEKPPKSISTCIESYFIFPVILLPVSGTVTIVIRKSSESGDEIARMHNQYQ